MTTEYDLVKDIEGVMLEYEDVLARDNFMATLNEDQADLYIKWIQASGEKLRAELPQPCPDCGEKGFFSTGKAPNGHYYIWFNCTSADCEMQYMKDCGPMKAWDIFKPIK